MISILPVGDLMLQQAKKTPIDDSSKRANLLHSVEALASAG